MPKWGCDSKQGGGRADRWRDGIGETRQEGERPGSVEMADECLGMRGVPGTEKSKHEGRRAPGTPGGAGSRPVWGWSRVNVGSWEGSWEVRAEVGRDTRRTVQVTVRTLAFILNEIKSLCRLLRSRGINQYFKRFFLQ